MRFSFSYETSEEEIDTALGALQRVLNEMESTVRFLPRKQPAAWRGTVASQSGPGQMP